MIQARDILLDDANDDLLFDNGDFVIGYSDYMHQKHIIHSGKGHYKENPLVGVHIFQYLKSSGLQAEIKREIQIQLEDDNFLVNNIEVSNTADLNIKIDADRIK